MSGGGDSFGGTIPFANVAIKHYKKPNLHIKPCINY